MGRPGIVVLLLAVGVSACSPAGGEQTDDGEYGALVEACDLVAPATIAALSARLPETAPRQPQEPSRILTDRGDATECRYRFGDPDGVPITPYDELAPDTGGTPAYRYISVKAMRYHDVDGQTGTELARQGLASDPRDPVPNLAALRIDNGDIEDRSHGVESFTRIRAVDANLLLLIEYGGANIGAKPAGIPASESHDGALWLLSDAANRLPCRSQDC